MTIKLLATLKASKDDGTLSYLLLPYGEAGRTNVGKVTASKGRLTIPSDLSGMFGNLEHAPGVIASKPVSITETEEGLMLDARPLESAIGKALASEVAQGHRRGVSVEIDNPVIRNGALLAGVLSGYGHVETPAFPSAGLTASDVGDLADAVDDDTEISDLADETAAEVADVVTEVVETVLEEAADEDDTTDPTTNGEAMTARLGAARKPGMPPKAKGDTIATPRLTAADAFKQIAAAGSGAKLTAALSQLTQAGIFDVATQPQWLGELWSGVGYEPEYTPLINHADLTNLTIQGWRFKDKPVVSDWAGDGAEISSGAVSLEPAEVKASRLAAGWNVPRELRDFPNPEFWSGFFRLCNESYAEVIDGKVRAYLTAAANATTLAIPSAQLATLTATAPVALVKIVKGIRHLKRNLRAGKATFALLGEDIYDEWLFLTSDEAPEYIQAALGAYAAELDGVTIIADQAVGAGAVRVGTKATATLHELGGATPLRVSTEDIAHGNMTEAVFGYWGIMPHAKTGIVNVTTGA